MKTPSATSTPFVLTCEMVARAALPLLIEGKLQIQIHGGDRGCMYRHAEDSSPCVIGSALPDDLAHEADSRTLSRVRALASGPNALFIVRGTDVTRLDLWQRLHDFNDIPKLRAELESCLASTAKQGSAT